MKITYLYHSGFCVELERHILIFDYYQGILPVFDERKKLIIFVSHGHEDHYNQIIFSIKHPNITYILSIEEHRKEDVGIYYVRAHESLVVKELSVFTLQSTDVGVAYLVSIEGKHFYHAGDLNWWDWGDEDTPIEAQAMQTMYQHEIARIKEHIDVAFVPCDPRLKERYSKGIDYYMKHTDTSYIFPMHFANTISIVKQLLQDPISIAYRDNIIEIKKANEEFLIKL